MTTPFVCRRLKTPARIAGAIAALWLLISVHASSQDVGLYLRDFEKNCIGTYTYCSPGQEDNGNEPSCSNCTGGPCWLWLSNDIWIQADKSPADGEPDGTTGYNKPSSGCPEDTPTISGNDVTTAQNEVIFVAIRVLVGSDFPAAGGTYTYEVKLSGVLANSGITYGNFGLLVKDNVTFTKAAAASGGAINSDLTVTGTDNRVYLLTPAKDGFVVFLKWKPTAAGHFCLMAEIKNITKDAAFDNTFTSASDFGTYVSENNNVAWRNIQVVAPVGKSSEGARGGEMMIHGPEGEGMQTFLEIEAPAYENIPFSKMYTGVVDWSSLPQALQPNKESILQLNRSLVAAQWNGNLAAIPLIDKLVFPPVMLAPGSSYPLKFNFTALQDNSQNESQYRHAVHVIQYKKSKKDKERVLVGGNMIMVLSKETAVQQDTIPKDDEVEPPVKVEPCVGLLCWLKTYWWILVILAIILIVLWRMKGKKS